MFFISYEISFDFKRIEKDAAAIKCFVFLIAQSFAVSDLVIFSISFPTDYRRPMKPFFIEIQNFWAWDNKLG